MSLEYHEKVIELMAIHKNKDQFYLQIKLLLEQEIELFWKIDESIAIQLQQITDFEKKYKYRLSYYTFWNPSQKHHRSYLTKTFLEYSERIYFTCTEEYIQILDQLKHIKDITQIHNLSFVTTQIPEEQQKVKIQIKDESEKTKRKSKPYQKFTLIAALIIGVISIGYLKYMNLSLDQTEQVEAEESIPKVEKPSTKSSPKAKLEKKNPAVPVVQLKSTVNYNVPKGKVALTFDDGPSKYSKKMVDVLKKYKVGGTFFYIGTNVKNYPECVKYAKKNGFSIGSHSLSHSRFTALPIKKQEKEILQSNQLIKQITGEPVVLFRPPYGAKNNSTVKLAQKYNLDIVLWNIDTEDWKSRNSKIIIQSIKKEKTSGSIILLHESQATLNALPQIIEYLQKQDLEIVSLK